MERAFGIKNEENRGNYFRWILNILCVAGIIMIGFFGLRYAITMDLDYGINKAPEAEVESWTPLEKGQTLEQEFTVGHNFNGISFMADYSPGAAFRSVRVSVENSATKETVLERSVPVWCLRKGEYTFFATKDVIPANQPTSFILRITTSGVGSGHIYLGSGNPDGTGQSSTGDEESRESGILCGIVTDYHRSPHYNVAVGAAVLLLCAWLFMLLIFAARKKEKNMGILAQSDSQEDLLRETEPIIAVRKKEEKTEKDEGTSWGNEKTEKSKESSEKKIEKEERSSEKRLEKTEKKDREPGVRRKRKIGRWEKRRKGRRKKAGEESRERLLFFASYFVVATFIELIALTFDLGVTYQDVRLGASAGSVELKDDVTLDQNFVLPGNCVTGLTLYSFDTNGLVFTDETISYTITDVLTGKDVQHGTIPLAGIEVNDDGQGSLYIPFDDRYNDQTFLAVHLESEGLFSKGVLFGTAWAAEDSAHFYLSGERQDCILDGSLTNAVYYVNHRKTFLLYAAALAFGAVLWALAEKKEIPVWNRSERKKKSCDKNKAGESEPVWDESRNGERGIVPAQEAAVKKTEISGRIGAISESVLTRRNFIGFAITAGLGLLLIEWAYSTTVSRAVTNVTPYIASYANSMEEWSAIPTDENESLSQTFTATEDQLAGVGLQISAGNLGEDSLAAAGDSSIRVVLSEENGTILSDLVYPVSALQHISDVTNSEYRYDSENPTAKAGLTDLFRFFPFDNVIPDSAGKTYVLSVSLDPASIQESTLLIAHKPATQGGGANLLTLYEEYQSLPGYFLAVSLISLVMLCLLYWTARKPSARLLPLYFFAALAAGMVVTFVIPINLVPDEADHIGSIYQMSNRILGVNQAAGNGFIFKKVADIAAGKRLEGSLIQRYQEVMSGLFRGSEASSVSGSAAVGSGGIGAVGSGIGGTSLLAAPYRDIMSNTTVWTYLPSALGFTLARVLGGNFVTEVMCARWANLVIVSLLITLGLWKCPYGKRGFAAAALFPMLIQMISSCSYDAMIIGYSFLFIGYAFHVLMESDISMGDLVVLAMSGFLLLQNKQGVYIPVIALLLLLPVFRRKKKYRWLTFAVIIAGAAVFVILYAPYLSGFSSASTAAQAAEGGNYTAAYLVSHPLQFLHIVENTALLQGDDLLMSTIAYWLGSGRIYVPTYAVVAVAVLAWLSAHERDQDRVAAPGRAARIWMTVVIVIGILFMDLAFLISMTSVGGNVVPGLQGRYFLPYALILLLILSGDSLPGHVKNPNRLIFWIECVQFFIVVFAFRYLFGYSA